MQQQLHISKEQPDTSRRYRQQRRLVTLILLVALGATVGILIHQGVISSSWLVFLPWIILALLVLVMLWAVLWLLKYYDLFRGSWVKIAARLLQLLVVLALLGFSVWAIITGVAAVCSSSHGDCWNNSTSQLNILFIVLLPALVGIMVLVQTYLTYLTYRQTRQAEAVTPVDRPLPSKPADDSSPQRDRPQAPHPASVPLSPAHSLIALPPQTDPRIIEQRADLVRDIYTQLTDQHTNAVILTGIGGAGKSTLAALVYRYEESQQALKHSSFPGDPLWLTLKESVTMTELTSGLLELLGTAVPNIENLPPPPQALALFNALSATEKPRLIVVDQFETLLNPSTGQISLERSGIGEWLEALNNRPARCRLLFTSRVWPRSTHDYVPAYLQEYPVERLSVDEGVALLHKQGVAESQATEKELRAAVERCQGHPFSLTLLAAILRNSSSLTLKALLTDALYEPLWRGRIALGLLDYIYQHQLNAVQRKLLGAFSIYRGTVPLQAAQALMTVSAQDVLQAWEVLCLQHLLQDAGELRYRLHPIVAEYACNHLDESSEQANQQALHLAHAQAATYYEQAAQRCLPREKRRGVTDVQSIIEAIWHWCQADRWQEGYELMNRERIFEDVNRWGGNSILLELCLLFFPLAQWHPERRVEALLYSRVAYLYDALGQKQEALRYYEQALAIGREVGDRGGEGTTLNNIGMIYFQEEQYKVALACFWLAQLLFLDVQSPYAEHEERMIAVILQKVGEQEFAQLFALVQEKAVEIVMQAMRDGLK